MNCEHCNGTMVETTQTIGLNEKKEVTAFHWYQCLSCGQTQKVAESITMGGNIVVGGQPDCLDESSRRTVGGQPDL